MSLTNESSNRSFRGMSSSYSSNSRNIFSRPTVIDNTTIDYNLVVRKQFTVGERPEKDMNHTNYDDEMDPFTFQATLFPNMADFVDANIVQGDKLESDRLNATYWSDLGQDTFDNWGYFFIYDVAGGKYYFPLLKPINQFDGMIVSQTFYPGFGEFSFTISHGWLERGIFLMNISCSNQTFQFKFGTYGNFGSDGQEVTSNLTTLYDTNPIKTLYYHHLDNQDDQDEGEENETGLYSYFVPYNTADNATIPYTALYTDEGDVNSTITKTITNGIRIFYSKENDVKDFVINYLLTEGTDLSSSDINGNITSQGNILAYGSITSDNNVIAGQNILSQRDVLSARNIIANGFLLQRTTIEYLNDSDYTVPPALLPNTHFMSQATTGDKYFRLPSSTQLFNVIENAVSGSSFRFTINNINNSHKWFLDLEYTDLNAINLLSTEVNAGCIATFCVILLIGEGYDGILLQESYSISPL